MDRSHIFLAYWWQWALGALAADLYVVGNANWIAALALAYGSVAAWGTLSLVVGLTDVTLLHYHVTLGLILTTDMLHGGAIASNQV